MICSGRPSTCGIRSKHFDGVGPLGMMHNPDVPRTDHLPVNACVVLSGDVWIRA